jgi:hypothetical protein
VSDVEAVTVEEGIEGAEGDEGDGSVSPLPLPTKVANFTFEEVSFLALALPIPHATLPRTFFFSTHKSATNILPILIILISLMTLPFC